MKNIIKTSLLLSTLIFVSCDTTTDSDSEQNNDLNNSIVYQSVNKEFVVITDVKTLKSSNDEISIHIDSILNGQINTEFISTGQKYFDLNADNNFDLGFEIIDLCELRVGIS